MGRLVNYDDARQALASAFARAEAAFAKRGEPPVSQTMQTATKRLFLSKTQAFREALVGCVLARILDPEINIRLPYANQGNDAFNGRTLDERVVNPFFREKAVPCSKGPYLSTFRRNIQFNEETAKGLRDRQAYSAFLDILTELEESEQSAIEACLLHLLFNFVSLRDGSQIPLSRVKRFRLEQHESLVASLLQTASGGLLPVLLAVATFQTLKSFFLLPWEIDWQGINVADSASGVAGDITVKRDGAVVLAVEVTERAIDKGRLVSTFNTKIAPHGLDDYLFFFTASPPTNEARETARNYFAQGHDINFVLLKDWIVTTLTMIGPAGRTLFTGAMVALLSADTVPATLKVAWNEYVQKLSLGSAG